MRTLEELWNVVERLQQDVELIKGGRPAQVVQPRPPFVNIDGEHGDPTIKFDPKYWKGPSQVGKFMSQCPAKFLHVYAHYKEWCAKQDDAADAKDKYGKPKSEWSRKDAEKARKWAARIEERDPSQRAQDPDGLPF